MLQNDVMSRKPILGVYFIICAMVFIFERFFFQIFQGSTAHGILRKQQVPHPMETIKVQHSREIWSKTTAWADMAHDIVSEQEKDLLLGYCPGSNGCLGRWLFPPMDIFNDNFELWTGEWNTALDHIYRRLAGDISRRRAKLRTREKWKCWIRNNEQGQQRPRYLPSSADFDSVMEGVTRAGLQPTWHKKQLDDIDFPER